MFYKIQIKIVEKSLSMQYIIIFKLFYRYFEFY